MTTGHAVNQSTLFIVPFQKLPINIELKEMPAKKDGLEKALTLE